MKHLRSLVGKELESYFGSPMALIFLGVFLVFTLYTFFWVEAFFAGGLAELRGLFRWMPILLIFLISALTMRQWSEEQRSGTLETLLTLPVGSVTLVAAKFASVMIMVALALALTIPLPITVANLGNIDWGPVAAGYLATLLLSAAYVGLGLFASSRTDNQIVALIITVVVGGLLYFAGSTTATEFVPPAMADFLRAIGTDSRFQSIQRGVLDLRDLVYYLTLTGVFLTLNVLSVQSIRWSRGHDRVRQREILLSSLLIANLVLSNIWLHPLRFLRVDVTEQQEYSLSETTKTLLDGLAEPLKITGFFSAKTHPQLAPVVSGIADMLAEYDIAGGANVEVEVLDPTTDPDLELDATQTYGINPIPFQIEERYESAVRNSYFHVLIRYADQHIVLQVADLVKVTNDRDGTTNVQLDTLEYTLTRAIKQVVYGFQSVEAVLDSLGEPVTLSFLVTPGELNEQANTDMELIIATGEELAASSGYFEFEVVNPDAEGARFPREMLINSWGLEPYPPSMVSPSDYYFHLVLDLAGELHLIFPRGGISRSSIRTVIDETIQRTQPGFLRTVGLWLPPNIPTQSILGQQLDPLASWNTVQGSLSSEFEVEVVDLESGPIGDHIDVLFLIAPQYMSEFSLFAVDQFLMRGGSLIVAASNFGIAPHPLSGDLSLTGTPLNLNEMLAHHGIVVEPLLVLDLQNTPFPVNIPRQVDNLTVSEYQALDYPFFVDIRSDAMEGNHPAVSGLPAVTLNYASPITIDPERNAERDAVTLLYSSEDSWVTDVPDIQPNFEAYPDFGFDVAPEDVRKRHPLAVTVQGRFDSFFKDRPNPWLEEGAAPPEGAEGLLTEFNVIESSPLDTRLAVIGSAEFLDDLILDLMRILVQDQVTNNLLFVQNLVDWSQEDVELLSIRARGNTIRLLKPLTQQEQIRFEVLNYVVALLALVVIAAIWRWRSTNQIPLDADPGERML